MFKKIRQIVAEEIFHQKRPENSSNRIKKYPKNFVKLLRKVAQAF